FTADIARATGLLPSAVEDALWTLVAQGLVTGDGIAGLRALLTRPGESRRAGRLRAGRGGRGRLLPAGRWALLRAPAEDPASRAPGAHALGSRRPRAARAGDTAATVASDARRAAHPGGTRRGTRRAVRGGLRRRAVRTADGGRGVARAPPPARAAGDRDRRR